MLRILWRMFLNNSSFDEAAVGFFRNMLYYMRDQKKSIIYLDLNGSVNLKNFNDYNIVVKEDLDRVYMYDYGRAVTGNIENLTTSYSEGDITDYENIILESNNLI